MDVRESTIFLIKKFEITEKSKQKKLNEHLQREIPTAAEQFLNEKQKNWLNGKINESCFSVICFTFCQAINLIIIEKKVKHKKLKRFSR